MRNITLFVLSMLFTTPCLAQEWEVHTSVDEFDDSERAFVFGSSGELTIAVWCKPEMNVALSLSSEAGGSVFGGGDVAIRYGEEAPQDYNFTDLDTSVWSQGQDSKIIISRLFTEREIRVRADCFRCGYADGRFDLTGLREKLTEAGCTQ